MTLSFFSLVGFYGIIILYQFITPTQEYDTTTLKLVHVVFRHGNRTPAENICYPNDPYKNISYYPFGLGQLTNKGKVQEFRIGKALRKRYDSFLGSLYTPEILDGISTNVNRTKMSLQLVLSALFPPTNTLLEWNTELNWQPIPYNTDGASSDLLAFPIWTCPNYIKIYKRFMQSSAGLATQAPYKKLFEYVKIHTGWNVTSNMELWELYNTFASQLDWGLKLPSWANDIYPDALNEGGGQVHIQFTYNKYLRQLSGGFLLKKIINDSRDKIKGTLNPKDRKLFLYSAHDTTVGFILGILGLMYNHQPPYGAYVLIEFHKIKGVYGFKVFYQNYDRSEPLLLTIPGCETFCEFKKFLELHDECLPDGKDPCGHGSKNAAYLKSIYKKKLQHLRCHVMSMEK